MNKRDGKFHPEIERRFLIRYPDIDKLDRLCFARSEITQTYIGGGGGSSSRVRRSEAGGVVEYTRTEKTRVSDMTRMEAERRISRGEYESLLLRAEPGLKAIEKTRWQVGHKGFVLEIDVFPFWKDRALLEIELDGEEREIELPYYIEVIKEVTGDGRYTNRALAAEVPYDDIGQSI